MSIPSRPRAVVTGAGSGLGRAFVLEIAARPGARILCSDVDEVAAANTVELARAVARSASLEIASMRCDVADADQVEALAVEAERSFGGVDLVINNAGVAVAGEVGEIALDDWRWIVSINLMGVIHGCHAFAPRLRKQKSGHVINVASAAGLVATPGMAAYNATKFGVVGLSEALYSELQPHHVGVTVLCPTFFPTNIVDSARGVRGEKLKKMARRLMAASKLDANGVARAALDAADADRLYCVPMADGRAMWALKRLAPEQWHARIGPLLYRLANKKFA